MTPPSLVFCLLVFKTNVHINDFPQVRRLRTFVLQTRTLERADVCRRLITFIFMIILVHNCSIMTLAAHSINASGGLRRKR